MQHGASVITVFSDSRDHHHSSDARKHLTNITLCGCLLIDSNVKLSLVLFFIFLTLSLVPLLTCHRSRPVLPLLYRSFDAFCADP